MNAKSLVDELFDDADTDAFDSDFTTTRNLLKTTPMSNTSRLFHYEKLVPNPKNTALFDMKDVLSKVESILNVGLLQDPLVTLLPNSDNAMILAGHKRLAAIRYIVEELGHTEFEYVRCKVLNLTDLDADLAMIDTNLEASTLSSFEMMQALGMREEILIKKRAEGERITGTLRAAIAEKTSINETQVGNYLRCYKKLCDPMKNELREDRITLKEAIRACTYNAIVQEKLIAIMKKKECTLTLAFEQLSGEYVDHPEGFLKEVILQAIKSKKIVVSIDTTLKEFTEAMEVHSYSGYNNKVDGIGYFINVYPKHLSILYSGSTYLIKWNVVLQIYKETLDEKIEKEEKFLKEVEHQFMEELQTKVNISNKEIKISYSNISDLNRILEKLGMIEN